MSSANQTAERLGHRDAAAQRRATARNRSIMSLSFSVANTARFEALHDTSNLRRHSLAVVTLHAGTVHARRDRTAGNPKRAPAYTLTRMRKQENIVHCACAFHHIDITRRAFGHLLYTTRSPGVSRVVSFKSSRLTRPLRHLQTRQSPFMFLFVDIATTVRGPSAVS
jgi:hypothetical protein